MVTINGFHPHLALTPPSEIVINSQPPNIALTAVDEKQKETFKGSHPCLTLILLTKGLLRSQPPNKAMCGSNPWP